MTRTLLELLGKAICAWRKRIGAKPVHDFKRIRTPFGDGRVCKRCGVMVPVRARKAKVDGGGNG